MHGKPMGKAIFLEKKRIKDCLLDEGIPVMTCGEFLEEVKPLSTKG